MADRDADVPVAVTMGDPAGIGLDTVIMAWRERRSLKLPVFFLLADPAQITARVAALGEAVKISEITSPQEAFEITDKALPILPVRLPVPDDRPGKPEPANAGAILEAISSAVKLARDGRASSVVTCPIHKASLYQAGFRHPGHTEYLAELCGLAEPPVMMLACAGLRAVPVTIHLGLRQALDELDGGLIVAKGRILAQALKRDFAIPAPRIAVAGLNPHAGEDGNMGREEIEFIQPAVAALRQDGIAATGPFPPDTMFGEEQRQAYDAALCMYHDQALIPIKTLDFHGGVNITLGLPIVRTSPDHGTAFDLAGSGRARPDSLIAAIREADRIAQSRQSHG